MKKIQTIKPFFLIPIYLLFILFSFNVGIAQTISRTLEINKGLGLLKNSDFGIISKSDKVIHVFAYGQYLYDKTAGTIAEKQSASFMYGFKSNGNTNGAYQNISFGINERKSWWCYVGFCPFKYKVESRTVWDNSNSLKLFKKAVRARQHYTFEQIPNSGEAQFFALGDGTINVLIKVVLSSGANLSDITSIKIPGISEISGSAAFTPKVFAFFGNYGCANKQGAKDVANFVKTTIQPDIIVSAGNDSYHRLPSNECGTSFNDNNGALYNLWANTNRFISVLGNKDYEDGNGNHLGTTGQKKWKNYFDRIKLNNSYIYGNIEFFMINTNNRTGPGTDPVNNSDLTATKAWLATKLAASTKKYKIVVGHHAAYASGQNSSSRLELSGYGG